MSTTKERNDGSDFPTRGASGTLFFPDGRTEDPDGTLHGIDGTVLTPGDAIDGASTRGADGILYYPDGKTQDEDGVLYDWDGTVVEPDLDIGGMRIGSQHFSRADKSRAIP